LIKKGTKAEQNRAREQVHDDATIKMQNVNKVKNIMEKNPTHKKTPNTEPVPS